MNLCISFSRCALFMSFKLRRWTTMSKLVLVPPLSVDSPTRESRPGVLTVDSSESLMSINCLCELRRNPFSTIFAVRHSASFCGVVVLNHVKAYFASY